MPHWRQLILLTLALPLGGCLGDTPERARIRSAQPLKTPDGWVLEVEQSLDFSPSMLAALDNGIALRLGYAYGGCRDQQGSQSLRFLQLRYAAVRRVWELDSGNATVRRFARRSSLMASLDRVRLPLPNKPPDGCVGEVRMALDLTALPTPLRFPAFLRPAEWRMVSPTSSWQQVD